MYLSRAETETIDAAIARVEGRTGVQVVTAIVSKADAYAELPWMAFALGVSVAALVSVLVDRVRPDWITAHVALLTTVAILAVGGASAMQGVFVPAEARRFMRPGLRGREGLC